MAYSVVLLGHLLILFFLAFPPGGTAHEPADGGEAGPAREGAPARALQALMRPVPRAMHIGRTSTGWLLRRRRPSPNKPQLKLQPDGTASTPATGEAVAEAAGAGAVRASTSSSGSTSPGSGLSCYSYQVEVCPVVDQGKLSLKRRLLSSRMTPLLPSSSSMRAQPQGASSLPLPGGAVTRGTGADISRSLGTTSGSIDLGDAAILIQAKARWGSTFAQAGTWNLTNTLCTKWNGVTCDSSTSRVVSLIIKSVTLQGIIPPELSNLDKLAYLDLSGNYLSGSIPDSLSKIMTLTGLFVNQNELTGPTPAFLSKITSFNVRDNYFTTGCKYASSLPNVVDINCLKDCAPLGAPAQRSVAACEAFCHAYSNPLGACSSHGVCSLIPAGAAKQTCTCACDPGFLHNATDICDCLVAVAPVDAAALRSAAALWGSTFPYNSTWNTSLPCVYWFGITCDPQTGRVLTLNLSGLQLQGSLSGELGNLAFLTAMNMSNNQLKGCFPPSLANLANLRVLDLSKNKLEGPLPQGFSASPNISYFNVASNQLSGPIPQFRAQLTNCSFANNFFTAGCQYRQLGVASTNCLLSCSNATAGNSSSQGTAVSTSASQRSPDACFQFCYDSSPATACGGWGCCGCTGPAPLPSPGPSNCSCSCLPGSFLSPVDPMICIPYNCSLVLVHPLDVDPLLQAAQAWGASFPGVATWIPTAPCVSWIGVQCACDSGHASSLNLAGFDLQGPLPFDLGRLSFLTYLNLSNNALAGNLPITGSLRSSLKTLDLSNNQFVGPIPQFQAQLTLSNLSGNYFTSGCQYNQTSIRNCLFKCPNSPAPSQRSADECFSFCYDSAPATACGGRGTCSWNCQAPGFGPGPNYCSCSCAPASFLCPTDPLICIPYNSSLVLVHPRDVDPMLAAATAWGGSFPAAASWDPTRPCVQWAGVTCANDSGHVVSLSLGGFQLRGPIPSDLALLGSLTFMDLSNNALQFCGTGSLGTFRALRSLNLAGSTLTGGLAQFFVDSFPNVTSFNVGGNQLVGPIPCFPSQLSSFNFSGNYFTSGCQYSQGSGGNCLSNSSCPSGASLPGQRTADACFNFCYDSSPATSCGGWGCCRCAAGGTGSSNCSCSCLPGSFLSPVDPMICIPYNSSLVLVHPLDVGPMLSAAKAWGDSFLVAFTWDPYKPCVQWLGVTCANNSGHVISLNLTGVELQGSVATDLTRLAFLAYLNLSNNALAGSIPQFGPQVKTLDFSSNFFTSGCQYSNFSGVNCLYNCSNSTSLPPQRSFDLCFNCYSSFPATMCGGRGICELPCHEISFFCSCSSGSFQSPVDPKICIPYNSSLVLVHPLDVDPLLEAASVWGASFPATVSATWIPTQPCATWLQVVCANNSGHVTSLTLAGLGLQGFIPDSLHQLAFLTSLDLSNNTLDVCGVPSLALFKSIQQLNLNGNKLKGVLTQGFVNSFPNITTLNVENNLLTGPIPQLPVQATSARFGTNFFTSGWQYLGTSASNCLASCPGGVSPTGQRNSTLCFNFCYDTSAATSCGGRGCCSCAGPAPTGATPPYNCSCSCSSGSFLSPVDPLICIPYNHSLVLVHPLDVNPLLNAAATWGSSFPAFATWDPTQPCYEWTGVKCADNSGHVISLNLAGYRLQGPVPPQLVYLSYITYLNLESNLLSGPILALPTTLVYLNLEFNQLSGPIPLLPTTLVFLGLKSNQLNGTIPRSIGNVLNLKLLDLSNNRLSGQVPDSLTNVTGLTFLDLSSNALSSISTNLSSLPDLVFLDLSDNVISGGLPNFIFGAANLSHLSLESNQFYGSIPGIILQCKNLVYLNMESNLLNGPITGSVFNLTSLTLLDLSHNLLTGSIPANLGNLGLLKILDIASNVLTGSIPDAIRQLLQVEEIYLDNNKLQGTLSNGFLLLRNLSILNLQRNELTGAILSFTSVLYSLKLSYNYFTSGCDFKSASDYNCLSRCSFGASSPQRTDDACFNFCYTTAYEGPCLGFGLCGWDIVQGGARCSCFTGSSQSPIDPAVCVPSNYNSLYAHPLDVQALLALRNAWGGVTYYSWVDSNHCNQMAGISCDGSTARVIQLSLDYSAYVSGPVPSNIGALSYLTFLQVNRDSLQGTLPPEFGRLTKLVHLDLAFNGLHGPLPTEFGQLERLTFLDLSGLAFSSSVPLVMAKLQNLQFLRLDYCSLNNIYPNFLGVLRVLTYLSMRSNSISATIPSTMANILTLKHWDLGYNSLSEPLPEQLSALTVLTFLNLDTMNMGGKPVSTVLSTIGSLLFLSLSNCKIVSVFPVYFTKLSKLTYLRLRKNSLTSVLPDIFTNFGALQYLNLATNLLVQPLPTSFTTLASLNFLNLDTLYVNDIVPTQLYYLHLQYLSFRSAYINGTLPNTMLYSFRYSCYSLNLRNNQLSGSIPANLTGITNLQVLDLSYNNFSGTIVQDWDKISKLTSLNLERNSLSGPINSSLGACTNLYQLDLSFNQLSGTIFQDWDKVHSVRYVKLQWNQLSGSINSTLGACTNLQDLDLSHNQLSGTIFHDWTSITRLSYLNLKFNQLQGLLPNITTLPLSYLYLDNNLFSGPVLKFPGSTDISNNYLTAGCHLTQSHSVNLTYNCLQDCPAGSPVTNRPVEQCSAYCGADNSSVCSDHGYCNTTSGNGTEVSCVCDAAYVTLSNDTLSCVDKACLNLNFTCPTNSTCYLGVCYNVTSTGARLPLNA